LSLIGAWIPSFPSLTVGSDPKILPTAGPRTETAADQLKGILKHGKHGKSLKIQQIQ
jgi:hypothetical protein